MSQFQIRVRWLQATEWIPFDSAKPLKVGTILNTIESWRGEPKPIEYKVRVAGYKRFEEKHILMLQYDRSRNLKIGAVPWGTSTLTIDVLNNSVSAKWNSNPPPKKLDVERPADLIPDDLFEDLGLEFLSRRKRRQKEFRKLLLKCDSACALSGETTTESLEAAHVIGVDKGGGYTAANGILLRADLHRLFDNQLIRIKKDGTLNISNQLSAMASPRVL